MSNSQRSTKCPAPADVPPSRPLDPSLLNKEEQEVFKILNEKNDISSKRPKERSDAENKSLKACNKKLQKFRKEIVDGVLKQFPDLQKKPKTVAERVELHRIAQSEAEKEDSRNKNKERNRQKHAIEDSEAREKRRKGRQRTPHAKTCYRI